MPLDNWTVDPAVPEEEEDEHRRKLHSLSKRPRGDDSAATASKTRNQKGSGFRVEGKQQAKQEIKGKRAWPECGQK